MKLIALTLASLPLAAITQGAPVLTHERLKAYVEEFNAGDEELHANIPNRDAYAFLKRNIPLFECPDPALERAYYFRWWTYRKHVKETADGYVITEFLPKVSWSGKHNTISCPVGHHYYEGRWLRDAKYLDDYSTFWFRKGGAPRRYSCWIADALYARHLVTPNQPLLSGLLDEVVRNDESWARTHRKAPDFLYWQSDDRDGMECSIGGNGYRATLNSYLYGDACAIAKIAAGAGRLELASRYRAKADELKRLVQTQLWDAEAKFFKVMGADRKLADVRELHGYTPWYFNLPDPGYEQAWGQLMDPQGFWAPFGPTTAEQRHPKFQISYDGHECQWNGPSWPMATSVTLTAMANVLNRDGQDVISKEDYFKLLRAYTNSQQRVDERGKRVPWIDENLHPHTGDWISRTRLKQWKQGSWDASKGGKERGKDYNHSTYNDLVITGLVGLRPRADEVIEVNPLLPAGAWDYFCLDRVHYRGHVLTILWDKTGEKYGRGVGLNVFCRPLGSGAASRKVASAATLSRVRGRLTGD